MLDLVVFLFFLIICVGIEIVLSLHHIWLALSFVLVFFCAGFLLNLVFIPFAVILFITQILTIIYEDIRINSFSDPS